MPAAGLAALALCLFLLLLRAGLEALLSLEGENNRSVTEHGNVTVIFQCVWSVFKEHASSFRHSVNNKGSKQHDGKRNTS